ncbi:MAG: arginine--tRNA ligase [Candidatus Omnitrophica bacterium]|nr:arginine--tRNA ligase [Candidatus Omnitrophota bacterium]
MLTRKFEEGLKNIIEKCLREFFHEMEAADPPKDSHMPGIELEPPKDRSHGDISTNIALRISKQAKVNPMDLAQMLCERIGRKIGGCTFKNEIVKVEAKGPGFINFWYSNKRLFDTLGLIAEKKNKFGRIDREKQSKVNIEFVSANPTGPLTIAHGRQGAFGDTLANILEFAGHKVTREYYLNDEGNQITLLGESVRARYLELFGEQPALPEGGYKGQYIIDIATAIKAKYGARFLKRESLPFFCDFGCRWITDNIKKDLESFNVRFDVWFSQKKLARSGRIKSALNFLSRKKLLYKKGGAVWFKSTAFKDDKDRVVVKSTGEYTYLAPDIAYHISKVKRGFNTLIDIWGPDHHGYISRLQAAVKTFEKNRDSLQVLLVQLCTLHKEGKAVQMSTREGEFITLHELIGEVGKDVTRFFFLRRGRDSHLDFDMELAKKHSMDNPVYYIQYAHARISSILKFRTEKGSGAKAALNKRYLCGEKDIEIMKLLGSFPYVIEMCSKRLEVFPLISYLEEVAAAFHSYYDKHRIISDDIRQTEARLFLCLAIRIVISNGLTLLGVSSPETM